MTNQPVKGPITIDETPNVTTATAHGIMYRQRMDGRFDFLLIGRAGHGRSEAGNMILGRPDAFESSSGTASFRSHVTMERGEFEGKLINAVDTPGIESPSKEDNEQAIRDMVNHALQTINLNDRGFDLLLIVYKYGLRFTEDERRSIDILRSLYGRDFIRLHCAIVITHGDAFERKGRESFVEWCSKQSGLFGDLLAECQHRVLLFDNLASPDKRARQLRQLLQMASSIVEKHGLYTRDIFENANSERVKLIAESKRPRLSNQTRLQLDRCKMIMLRNPENKQQVLSELLKDLNSLKNSIQMEDNATGVFNGLLDRIRQQQEAIQQKKFFDGQRPDQGKGIEKQKSSKKRILIALVTAALLAGGAYFAYCKFILTGPK